MNPAWMQTGRIEDDVVGFNLAAPDTDDVSWSQVARSLSRQPRYLGHGRVAISVAEHSVRLADYMTTTGEGLDLVLGALVHDAHEAYTGDMTRPMQLAIERIDPDALAVVKSVGRLVQRVIEAKLGLELDDEQRDRIKCADLRIMQDERMALFEARRPAWDIDATGLQPLGIRHEGWGPTLAAREWLRRLQDVQRRR